MGALFEGDQALWVRYALASVVVLGLLILLFYVVRRVSGRRLSPNGQARPRQPRLGVVEVFDLDRDPAALLRPGTRVRFVAAPAPTRPQGSP